MKEVILLSIQPKWVQKILNGEKTIEIRKAMPKCELPIDVYVYCTKSKNRFYSNRIGHSTDLLYKKPNGEIIFGDDFELQANGNCDKATYFNGKVVAKFTLRVIDEIEHTDLVNAFMYRECQPRFASILNRSCMSVFEMLDYSSVRNLNAWHIEDLVIFDKALGLSDLHRKENKNDLEVDIVSSEGNFVRLSRAPQSWQYVYVGESQ